MAIKAKDPQRGRPKAGYFIELDELTQKGTPKRKRVPSVTTVLGIHGGVGGLARWYHEKGLEGIPYDECTKHALDAGSLAHDMIECDMIGADFKVPAEATPEMVTAATAGFGAFLRWKSSMGRFSTVHTEIPMVSKKHRYGGTIDFIGMTDDDKFFIADWKLAKSGRTSYVYQIAAYAKLFEENSGEEISGWHSIRIGKSDPETGDPGGHLIPIPFTKDQMEIGWEQFLRVLKNYETERMVKTWI